MNTQEPRPIKRLGMIPVLTTPAGRCLTSDNWQETGAQVVSFYLSELLMKPGYDFLNQLPSLGVFVGWPGSIVINATLPFDEKKESYVLQSHYDGRRIHLSLNDILSVIERLQPSIVVLPKGAWKKNQEACESLSESMMILFSESEVPRPSETTKRYGVCITYDEQTMSPESVWHQIDQHKDVPCYVTGALDWPFILDLITYGAWGVESNIPAADAYHGLVYSRDGAMSLLDASYAKQPMAIDPLCCCPVCRQGFSRAYLHHLYQQAPLLCQRLLVQHNVFYCLTSFTSE
jgi:queuine tRNA-ribosyltransferase